MKNLTKKELYDALKKLMLARHESSQEFCRASYSPEVQSVFDKIEKEGESHGIQI